MSVLDSAIHILDDLVGFPTVTSDSNLDLIEYAAHTLESTATGITLTHDPTGQKANLFATIGPPVDGGVVLSSHTDVVPATADDWSTPPFQATRREERILGRGTADMKGFIACAMAMAQQFSETPLRVPVHLALTFDEEVGCRGAPLLLSELASTGPLPRAAIVGEPTSMRVITAHKGCYEYTTKFTGLEGHGSAPGSGVNAVEYGMQFVGRLVDLHGELANAAPADSPFDPPHTTISVGSMTGGTARNIIAGDCRIEWEMRPVQRSDAERVKSELQRLATKLEAEMRRTYAEARIETVTLGEVEGLEPKSDSPAVALMRNLLDHAEIAVASYGTEAGLFARAGIPAVVCGPGSIAVAHRPDEYIEVSQLEACLSMMSRLGDVLSR